MNSLEKKVIVVVEILTASTVVAKHYLGEGEGTLLLGAVLIVVIPVVLAGYFMWLDRWYPKYRKDVEFAALVKKRADELGITVSELREFAYNDELAEMSARIRSILHPDS